MTFLVQLKSRVGLTLTKDEDLRITLNLDGEPITSTTHKDEAGKVCGAERNLLHSKGKVVSSTNLIQFVSEEE